VWIPNLSLDAKQHLAVFSCSKITINECFARHDETSRAEWRGAEEHVLHEIVSRPNTVDQWRVWCCEAFCSFWMLLTRTWGLCLLQVEFIIDLYCLILLPLFTHLFLGHNCNPTRCCMRKMPLQLHPQRRIHHLGRKHSSRLRLCDHHCTLETIFSHQAREKTFITLHKYLIFCATRFKKEKRRRNEKKDDLI